MFAEIGKIAAIIEDEEVFLSHVFALSEIVALQRRTKPRSPAYHLPKLRLAADLLEED